MSRESWTSLAERVERAGGADEDLDLAITNAVFGEIPAQMGGGWMAPAFTASVDDCLQMIADKLPGWQWVLHNPRKGLAFGASLSDPSPGGIVAVSETKPASAPLALLAAFCRARAASVIEIAGSGERE